MFPNMDRREWPWGLILLVAGVLLLLLTTAPLYWVSRLLLL